MIEVFLPILFGIFFGFLTGLLPGMNVNNLLPLILTFTFLSPKSLTIFIVSFSISQLLTQFFPSIFLGAPNENTAISVLPGHRLLLEGRGYEALKICLISALISSIFSILIVFSLQNFFKTFYYSVRQYILYPILFILIFMILSEEELKKILFSIFIFLLSGLLGLITLNSNITNQNIMFPLLSGFFGLSTLIISLKEKSFLPKQKIDEKLKIKSFDFMKSILLGTIFGLIVGFLPAVGVSQAAVLAQSIANLGDARNFLATISSINVANEIFSLNSLYLVNNPRSGSSVAIQRVLGELNFETFLLLIFSIVASIGISTPLILFSAKNFYKLISKINYTLLNISIIILLSSLVIIFSGLTGILIFITSASIGILCVELKVKRTHCMGCLLFPSILFFSGYTSPILNLIGI